MRSSLVRVSSGDQALALPFAAGHSYTGEETVELSVHGSRASVEALIASALQVGARMAEPGEFTLRAFANGRMDLAQAEGVRDSIGAQTAAQLRQANLHREGALSTELRRTQDRARRLWTRYVAWMDFPDEVETPGPAETAAELEALSNDVRTHLSGANLGRMIRDGVRVAIVGLPNAGKSSLLNAVLGFDRAIVTTAPGTTRDYLEESIEFDGLRFVLVDTAGLRAAATEAEEAGVERARQQLASADLAWHVYDASAGWSEGDEEIAELAHHAIRVANKCDLGCQPGAPGLRVSALAGTNLQALLRKTADRIPDDWLERPLIRTRHENALQRASTSIGAAREALGAGLFELVVAELELFLAAIDEILGVGVSEDVLDAVFRDFCVGK